MKNKLPFYGYGKLLPPYSNIYFKVFSKDYICNTKDFIYCKAILNSYQFCSAGLFKIQSTYDSDKNEKNYVSLTKVKK